MGTDLPANAIVIRERPAYNASIGPASGDSDAVPRTTKSPRRFSGLIVGVGFFEPLHLLLFVRDDAIEGAQRVLDACMVPTGLPALMCAV